MLFALWHVAELPFFVGAIAIVGGIGYATINSLARHWRAAKESEHLAVLKQQMLDRGMSADDIATVINAGMRKPDHMM